MRNYWIEWKIDNIREQVARKKITQEKMKYFGNIKKIRKKLSYYEIDQ